MSILRRIEKSLDHRLRAIFGGSHDEPGEREAIELYRDAIERIASRVTVGKRGERIFPFDRITVELMADSPERKAVLETLFDAAQLADDVRATLTEERATPPENLTVFVHYPEEAVVEMRVVCEKTEPATAPAVAPVPEPEPKHAPAAPVKPMRLVTFAGVSQPAALTIERTHVSLGRDEEVIDSLGRPVRRNDLFFPEGGHEANSSVSRSHAHLRFDTASGEWRIYDDGSSFGTGIFREGRRIDVPAHASRGVLLRAGDEICLGQARLRFEDCLS